MPRLDGTGPDGQGQMTGRGMGPCNGGSVPRRGFGGGFRRNFGKGRGFGRIFGWCPFCGSEPTKADLENEKKVLQEELKALEVEILDYKESK